MVEVWLPYGKTDVHISIQLRNLLGTAEPDKGNPVVNTVEEIGRSLLEPIESETLGELTKPGSKVAVAVDGTMTPHLAASGVYSIVHALRRSEVHMGDVCVIVGNGLRGRSDPEVINAISSLEGFQSLKVVEHSPAGSDVTEVGTTSAGTKVRVSSAYSEADLRIAIGDVRLDYSSGLKGAQSTVLPALSDHVSIERNRRLAFNGDVKPGSSEGNPVYTDELEAAKMAHTDLAVNLVTNGQGNLLKAYSGELEASMRESTSMIADSYKVQAEENADIIIVSAGGSRFDFDLYNSIWALRSVTPIAKRGATIILLSECTEGLGAEGLETLAQVDTISELRRRYMLGARAVYLIKSTLRRNEVILVSALPNYLAEPLGFTVVRTANDAIEQAMENRRRRKTLIVTHGCSTVPYVL
jgi:nickel-dependent lactate racemase